MSTPFGSLAPRRVNRAGSFKKATTSSNSALASSHPRTSEKRVSGFAPSSERALGPVMSLSSGEPVEEETAPGGKAGMPAPGMPEPNGPAPLPPRSPTRFAVSAPSVKSEARTSAAQRE